MKTKIIVSLTALTAILPFVGCNKSASVSLNDRATAMALDVVSNSLVAPTSAKFSAVSCVQRSDNTFLISGRVDSQNSFGAMLRNDFNCVLTNLGNNRLDWLGVSVGGEAKMNDRLIPKDIELLSSQTVILTDETSLQKTKYKCVKGVVKNISTHALKTVSISFNLETTDGTPSGTASAYMTEERLEPNATWNFTTETFDFDLTAKFGEMNSYP